MGIIFLLAMFALSFYLGYRKGMDKISRSCPWCGNVIKKSKKKQIDNKIEKIFSKRDNKWDS